ncbi:hypothetical protein [Paractinoplanes rishiriensis]|uniref:Uncharacterized protein n=1 Tax=Paractinoplanes rishiriensis TaxID=1050105 RepID=A0A919MRT2_9ACTN|nr:hypothetical protein [Actinoplanes rishiriensis]GIE92918.1 hypothetical protein Ari01nite_03830 [Actinoplanes rishiriensis]
MLRPGCGPCPPRRGPPAAHTGDSGPVPFELLLGGPAKLPAKRKKAAGPAPDHPDHDERLEWLDLDSAAEFDSAPFDAAAVTRALTR